MLIFPMECTSTRLKWKLKFLNYGKYRNIIDMNTGLSGFAAGWSNTQCGLWMWFRLFLNHTHLALCTIVVSLEPLSFFSSNQECIKNLCTLSSLSFFSSNQDTKHNEEDIKKTPLASFETKTSIVYLLYLSFQVIKTQTPNLIFKI